MIQQLITIPQQKELRHEDSTDYDFSFGISGLCLSMWLGVEPLPMLNRKAETDGKVASTPTARDTSIAAEKTTDLQRPIFRWSSKFW